ncbi:MAG: AIR synthase-related protein, partial [Desulfovibrionales bacterium]
PRILPKGVCAEIEFGTWKILPVFHWAREKGGLSWPEMLQIFNCGIGYVIIAAEEQEEEILSRAEKSGHQGWKIGVIRECADEENEGVTIRF